MPYLSQLHASHPSTIRASSNLAQLASRPCVSLSAGHLVEALMSKVGAIVGSEGDATPFTDVTVENISNTLHA